MVDQYVYRRITLSQTLNTQILFISAKILLSGHAGLCYTNLN